MSTADRDPADERFADLLDAMLQQVLDGSEPDLDALARQHPDLAHRVEEAWSLASGVAGRREPGRPVLGGYAILRELGRGGMGTVYLARQEALDREVAVKVLPHSLGLSPRAKRRFLEEARALARVRSDHVVRIHRVIDHAEMLAFEMEYVDGPSLTQALVHLRGHGAAAGPSHLAELLGLPAAALGARTLVEYFVRLGIDIARALDLVHRAGLIHRDVKPSNILLRRDGRAVLADFGLARELDLSVSRAGAFAGTPIYSSPEQLRGDPHLDARADIYSLAATLYEAIALAPPLAGRSTADVLRRIEDGTVPPLRKAAPHVPRDLETILQKAMERQPADRYASAAELADDLERLLTLQPIRARPAGLLRRAGKFARRNRRTLLAAGAGALAVTAAMLPVLDHVAASGSQRARAAELVRTARLRLVSPESRQIAWHRAVWGDAPRLRRLPPDAADPADVLASAVADYGRALTLVPDLADAATEQGVVRVVRWLRTESPRRGDLVAAALASPGFAAASKGLPPLTLAAARQLAAGSLRRQELAAQLPAASPQDRLALGLLAFLLGDFLLCEQSWTGLDTVADHPLLDVGLGIMYLADARPDAAYVRLLQARRTFPESRLLALELADAALARGELQAAQDWLLLAGDRDGPRRQRMTADLLAAAGDLDAARAAYLRLQQADPSDPVPLHRRARLCMAAGDLGEADRLLQELLRRWPDVARFRLDAARVALQRRDLPRYLTQVVHVLAADFGRERSRGTAADLLEILRLGGLTDLHAVGLAATGHQVGGLRWHGFEQPLRAWVRPALLERVLALLPVAARVPTAWAELRRSDPHSPDQVRWACRATALLCSEFPGALQSLPPLGQWVLRAWLDVVPRGITGVATGFLFHLTGGLDPRRSPSLGSMQNLLPPATDPDLFLGSAIAAAGDLDGDGIPELLVGSTPRNAATDRGLVRVAPGRPGHVLHLLPGPAPRQLFGFALAGLDDTDGDGCPDWIVGAPGGDDSNFAPGHACVVSGAAGAILRTLTGDHPGFGVCVARTGDLDGDGCADFLVGSSPDLRNSTAQGKVTLFSGRDGRVLRVLGSGQPGVWFGSAAADAGDVDGDGVHDVIVGGNHGGAPGLVRVFSGRDGRELLAWLDDSTETGFGCAVCGPGDLDGDGHADLLVGANGNADRPTAGRAQGGRVFVFSGRDGRLLQTVVGDGTRDSFGQSLVALGDVDGDGVGDWAAGAPGGGPVRCGAVQVHSGRDGRLLARLTGAWPGSLFGLALARACDTDGDGEVDLAVSAPGLSGQGQVWLAPLRPHLAGGGR